MKKMLLFSVITLFMCACGASGGAPKEAEQKAEEPQQAEQAKPVEPQPAQEPTKAEQEIPKVSENVVTDEGFDQFAPPEKGDKIAVIKTSMGDIKVKFFAEDAPKAVENFTTHAKNGYYNNVTFHRILNNFMIQGGDPEGTGRSGESVYGADFEDEFTARLHNYRGAISMANKGPNTNGSQFFIVQAGPVGAEAVDVLNQISAYEQAMYQDNRTLEIISGAQRFTQKSVDIYKEKGGTPWLDGGFPTDQSSGHTVFGQVFEGMDVVDAIAAVAVDANGKPSEPVVIESIEVTEF